MSSDRGAAVSPGESTLARTATAIAQRPAWIEESSLWVRAYSLAETAHRSQRRPTDDRLFLEHVTEVGTFLHQAAFDEQIVAAGLLHDAIERGTLSEQELRDEMGETICELVLALTEDPTIESFDERKLALREQVAAAGGRALTVFAADKLSDILGLRRGIATFGRAVEERIGTTVAAMAGHYGESVELIELRRPGSTFLPMLRSQLEQLAGEISPSLARTVRA